MNALQAAAAVDAGVVIVDLRPPRSFAMAHVPGAINLQFNRADLADRAQLVLPSTLRLVVHAEPEPVARVAMAILENAGYTVLGYLDGGLKAWRETAQSVATMPLLDVDALHERLHHWVVIDAREPFEYRHGHIAGALTIPSMRAWYIVGDQVPQGRLAVYCADQVRSSLVASILRRHGHDTSLVIGGMADWLERGYPVETEEANAPVH